MDSGLTRRVQPAISYAESPDSENRSPFNTPPFQQNVINLDESEDMEEEEEEGEIQYTTSRTRGGLRERKPNKSLKALENGEKSTKRIRPTKRSAILELVGGDLTPIVSQRVAIRQEITTKTAANRNRFFVEKKDFWLPLLPQNNYVRKLVEKDAQLTAAERAKQPAVIPYEEIEKQPKGVKAVMKPYQLSGLSFLVYLQKNGLSGILGISTPCSADNIHSNQFWGLFRIES
jgi:SWI/SNF-related matrix-associated actin-dependent regulator of chromatin subfamily A member 5